MWITSRTKSSFWPRRLPVGGETVQTLAQYLFALAAPHHVRHHSGAVAAPQVPHAHGDLPGLLGHVHLLEDPQAVLAVAALGGSVLPKVVEDVLPQAAGGVAVARHGLQPPLVLLGQLLLGPGVQVLALFAVGQQEPGQTHVLAAVQQKALGGLAVPPGPARLLVVALQVLGHVVVDDKADVGLVNAHAKGVGGHHHRGPVVEEVLLVFLALLVGQARVVAGGGKAPLPQGGADLLHRLCGWRSRRCRSAPGWASSKREQLLQLVLGAAHLEVQVGPVKAW